MAFADKLSALVAMEMSQAHGNHNRQAALLEGLARKVGFSIAIMARGNPEAANNLLEGATAYIYEEASRLAKFGELMSRGDRP